MNRKLIWSIFWALIGVSVIVVSVGVIQTFIPPLHRLVMPWGLIGAVVIFIGLGVTLLVLTVKTKVERRLKVFLLLTEASFVGLLVGFISLFVGQEILFPFPKKAPPFLDRVAAFLMIMALVCVPTFLVGAVGSVVLVIKKSGGARKSPSI